MEAARRRSSKLCLLPVLLSKAGKRISGKFKRYQIPISYKLIKYPDITAFYNPEHRGVWFFSNKDRCEIINSWKALFKNKAQVIDSADEICEHAFDLLGSGKTYLGREISWNSDFKSGKSWPADKPLTTGEINAPGGHADIKVPWELSRFQHLVTLGQAYWLVENERYAREFVDQINSWIDKNPWGKGPNWACTMDVAIRAANWVMAYHFFEDSPSFDDASRRKMLKSMWEHGWFIERNLERGAVNGNHLISDLAGLFAVGVFFQENKVARRWRDLALNALFDEMRVQVLEDGVDYEKSISYHRLVLELFTYSFCLAEVNGLAIPMDIRERWEKMFEFTAAYTKPDGTAPQFGDTDDGMFYKLSTRKASANGAHSPFLDHRYLLSIGALLFERADFARVSGEFSEEAFWALGAGASSQFDTILNSDSCCTSKSKAFEASGFYVIRSNDHYAMIDAGDNGMLGLGAHAHNDTLSFELFDSGVPLVIDPGTYLYTANPEWRNRFRSTSYHNTVMIDGQEIHPMSARWLFGLPDAGEVKILRWDVCEDVLIFEAEHNAYCRLKDPVIHRRKVIFDKNQTLWQIEDSFLGSGEHKFESRLHFAPDINVAMLEPGDITIESRSNKTKKRITISSESTIESVIEDGWYSPAYGRRMPIKVLNCKWTGAVPREVVIRICACS